jgi:hypothetical protein
MKVSLALLLRNVSLWTCTLVCWLCASGLLTPERLRGQTPERERLLIVEATAADAQAAARLAELTEEHAQVERWPGQGDASAARGWLEQTQAARAVVLDTEQRRVEVLERDGRTRARQIDGEPTPYLMAFVASELLALEANTAAKAPSPPPPPPATHFSRFLGVIGLEISRPYTSAWLLRPKLGLSWWVRPRLSESRWRLACGADLAGPGRVERSMADAGRVRVVRWDTTLRLAGALLLEHWSVEIGAHARAGVQRASYAEVPETEQRTLSLGFGPNASVEWRVLDWLGLVLGADLALMPRRAAFTLQQEPVLRDSFLFFSASLGLVFGTRPR